jgi:hypothetical protein
MIEVQFIIVKETEMPAVFTYGTDLDVFSVEPNGLAAPTSTKRGLLVNKPVDQPVIDAFGPFSAYYSYQTQVGGGRTIYGTFVPMFSEPGEINATTIAQAKANGTTLLTFNEPDGGTQNLSVIEALSHWSTFEGMVANATGQPMRLGSPAVSQYSGGPKVWIDDFMTQATAQGKRVDFIAIHFYTNNVNFALSPTEAATELVRQMQELYSRWGRPIWITEFAYWLEAGSTYEKQLAFMQAALPQLDALPFVEKYFWWTPNHYVDAQRPGWTNSLADASMQLNSLGQYYKG